MMWCYRQSAWNTQKVWPGKMKIILYVLEPLKAPGRWAGITWTGKRRKNWRCPDRNTFVVTSRIDEELTRKNGCLTLDVKQWYPVAPIKRDYKSMENHEKERIFYPSGYLDAYDLEQGDYVPVIIHRDIDYYSRKAGDIE